MADPSHPSLRFKQVHVSLPDVFSARVSRDCRVIGARSGDEIVWFWIRLHDDYELMLRRL